MPKVSINGLKIFVEVSDTPQKHAAGLSDRGPLQEGWGMLFIFEKPDRYSFWIYGMRFPLDIILISADGRIVHIVQQTGV